MPRPKNTIPTYRLHSASNQAIVTLTDPYGNRKDFLLGPYQSAESKRRYDELLTQWIARGRALDWESTTSDRSNNDLFLAFLRWASQHYECRGRKSCSELENLKAVVRITKKLFGSESVDTFTPKKLKACRAEMIQKNWSRKHINRQINRLRRIYRWGVSEEFVPPSIIHGLCSVPPLRLGENGVQDRGKVLPVSEEVVQKCLPYMQTPVAAIVQLMLFTGARAGEIVILRTCDVDRSGDVWVYRPHFHKTEKHGHERLILLGPEAQKILIPWLNETYLDAYCFSPKQAEILRGTERRTKRQTPLTPSQRNRQKKKNRKRPPGHRYEVTALGRSIVYATAKADREARKAQGDLRPKVPKSERLIPHWHPHQLRHTAATRLRSTFGIELARIILGHTTVDMTNLYAERDLSQAIDAMRRIG